MGYEVIYYYKESADANGVYKDEVLSKTTKIGKMNEDVSLDLLANKIISQLARRNILIVDVEIYEYAKKKIRFKESDSGIVIKNKKFNFDKSSKFLEDYEEEDDVDKIFENEELLNKIKEKIFSENKVDDKKENSKEEKFANYSMSEKKNLVKTRRAIREEIYDPELIVKSKIENKGYKFTVGRKYPIYKEKSLGMGILNYITKDDSGKEVEVTSECFVVPPAGLSFDTEYVQSNGQNDIDLWKNVSLESNMPEIRR